MTLIRTPPPRYVRESIEWQRWLGKIGSVLSATEIRSNMSENQYSLVFVKFDNGDKHIFSSVPMAVFNKEDRVVCVLRRILLPQSADILEYTIKVTKLNN